MKLKFALILLFQLPPHPSPLPQGEGISYKYKRGYFKCSDFVSDQGAQEQRGAETKYECVNKTKYRYLVASTRAMPYATIYSPVSVCDAHQAQPIIFLHRSADTNHVLYIFASSAHLA